MIKLRLKTICLFLTLLLLSFNITNTKADDLASEYSAEEIKNATEIMRKLKEEGYDPNEPFASEEEIRKAIEIVKKTKVDKKKTKEEDENLPSWKKSPKYKKLEQKYTEGKIRFAMKIVTKLMTEGYDPNKPFASEKEIKEAIFIVNQIKKVREEVLLVEKKAEEQKILLARKKTIEKRLKQKGFSDLTEEEIALAQKIKEGDLKKIFGKLDKAADTGDFSNITEEEMALVKKFEESDINKIITYLKQEKEHESLDQKKAEEQLITDEQLIDDEPVLKLVSYNCKGMHGSRASEISSNSGSDAHIIFELDKDNRTVKTHASHSGATEINTFEILKMNNRRVYLQDINSSSKFYWYYGTDQHTESARYGSHFFACDQKDSSTSKIAKADTQTYSKPKLNLFSGGMLSQSVTKTQLSQYNVKSATSYYFFEASSNLMSSLQLLYRAYDQNTEADKLQSQIRYLKESKSSEAQRLKSTKQILDVASKEIAANIKDESIVLSDQGRVYYQQSLPYAVTAAASSVLLYKVVSHTIIKMKSSDDLLFAALANFNELYGMATILPKMPGFARNVASTTKLIFTGAKTKKIKDKAKNKESLDELELDF